MKIYNTLTKQKEEFEPREDKKVQMFVCGPTVFDYVHIGNARPSVFFDVVAKYMRYRGYDVTYIQNITDIDNKIIERAQKDGVDPLEYAKKYSDIFKEDMQALEVTAPEHKNATDHIPEVIKQVQTLMDKGNAYVIENDGIYFDLFTFPDYGKLSGRTAGMADDAVSRIDDSDKKRNRGDFALWKFSQTGDPSWPAPFGNGRPGWHIEDTAITEKYFGPQYDIHGGGQDLVFPHHEAEIAQQESASGKKPFVKYWMHNGFLVNKEQKMSKSLGNFQTVRELLKKYSKETLRLYLLSAHYRSPLNYSEETIKQSMAAVQRLSEFDWKISNNRKGNRPLTETERKQLEKLTESIEQAMEDDFNTPAALGFAFEIVKQANGLLTDRVAIGNLNEFDGVKSFLMLLGILPKSEEQKIPSEISELAEKREKLRKDGKWEEADKIRAQIEETGYQVEDTAYGPLVTLLHS